jgi:hypothetical protein
MAPVMSMLAGTWADIRPGMNISSPATTTKSILATSERNNRKYNRLILSFLFPSLTAGQMVGRGGDGVRYGTNKNYKNYEKI